MKSHPILSPGDALLIVDVQNDFLPGGALAVPRGNRVIPVLNRYLERFKSKGLPIYATRDWHPPNHCSFKGQGGRWPAHCVAESWGARFAEDLNLPPDTLIISKATTADQEAYSGFAGTDLAERLRSARVQRLFIGGLATDYCVLNTVEDALAAGSQVFLLTDAISAIDARPGDGERACEQMRLQGAIPLVLEDLRS
jgi:nicotinamidase-related amidase